VSFQQKAAVASARADAIAEVEASFQTRLDEAAQRATEKAMATVRCCAFGLICFFHSFECLCLCLCLFVPLFACLYHEQMMALGNKVGFELRFCSSLHYSFIIFVVWFVLFAGVHVRLCLWRSTNAWKWPRQQRWRKPCATPAALRSLDWVNVLQNT